MHAYAYEFVLVNSVIFNRHGAKTLQRIFLQNVGVTRKYHFVYNQKQEIARRYSLELSKDLKSIKKNWFSGDVIEVHSKKSDGWWLGELNGVTGVFPATYVVEID